MPLRSFGQSICSLLTSIKYSSAVLRSKDQSLPLMRSFVFRYSPPTAPVVTARKSARSLFLVDIVIVPPAFQSSASSSFYLIFLLLR
jgi:hypothetical protein